MAKKIFPFAIVIFVAILAVLDLTNYGIPPTHDAEYHVLRFQQFYKVLAEGAIYPRWAPDFNNGFGIPLFNYVYPLPNYIASIFHLLGFGFIESFKLNMVAASIVGAIFMYLWSRRIWGNSGGVVSSVFYTFSPYHLLDIYVRGSVGEVWALGLFPALLWSYELFYDSKKYLYFIAICVSLALIIYSHNILALMFFFFFVFYAAILMLRSRIFLPRLEELILVVFVGAGLASPFWLPALLESQYVVGLQIFDVTRHFTDIYKFFVPTWGYGLSPDDPLNPMSVQIGYANLFALTGSIVVLLLSKKSNRKVISFFVASFLVIFFLMTPYSVWFWKNVPFMSYFQFPWRLLSLEILISSFLAGSIVWGLKDNKHKLILSAILILITIVLSLGYAKAPFYHKRGDGHYLSRSNFTDGTNSPGNVFNTKWLGEIPPRAKSKIEVIKGSADVKIDELKSTTYSFSVNSKESSKVLINTAYFPGWTAEINGRQMNIEESKGKMTLRLDRGENNVRVFLDSTLIQKLSYIYFMVSVLTLALYPGVNVKHLRGVFRLHLTNS